MSSRTPSMPPGLELFGYVSDQPIHCAIISDTCTPSGPGIALVGLLVHDYQKGVIRGGLVSFAHIEIIHGNSLNFRNQLVIFFFSSKMRRLLTPCLHTNRTPRSIWRMRPLMHFSSFFGNCERRPHTNSIAPFFFNGSQILILMSRFTHICICFICHHLRTQITITFHNTGIAGTHSILVINCVFRVHPIQLLLFQMFISKNYISKRPYK